MFLPVILAGGNGSRLWPLSRQQLPKQFLSLLGGPESMLQATLSRLKGTSSYSPFIVCNEEHRFIVAEQLRQRGISGASIYLEPVPKSTAPAVCIAALHAVLEMDDPILLVLSADHEISSCPGFHESISTGLDLAGLGKLVTFGVQPQRPETGYGYIQRGGGCGLGYEVSRFVEKPLLEKAIEYIEDGGYFWNSGIFMFRASAFLEELRKHEPAIVEACEEALKLSERDLDFVRINRASFQKCPENSVDYAVMERTGKAVMVPLKAQWSDVGSWEALWEVSGKDNSNNVSVGDVIAVDSRDSYIRSESRLVAVLGVDDLVIVETKDAVLVSKKSVSQGVKSLVDIVRRSGREEHINHREVYRPWGSYDAVEKGDRFQVKKITVKPGARLSLQMHHHRAEHWIVVSGTAKVTNGDSTYLVSENQSTYIPIGQIHSLENPGLIPLEIIEVQSGSYLGEDDIIRLQDSYGRV